MRATPNQVKALRWYCEKNNYIPQISAHPTYYFRDKSGNEHNRHIQGILKDWDEQRKVKNDGS